MITPKESDKEALKILLQLEAELFTRLSHLAKDLSKSHSRDSGEQAVERENDEIIVKLESDAKQELQQVHDAITRIDHGKYCECSSCGCEISPERLKALPYTTLCMKCAEG